MRGSRSSWPPAGCASTTWRSTTYAAPTRPSPPCEVDLTLHCSTGTYVRAVARDLGAQLGTGGHLTALRRTTVGPFALDAARTLEQLEAEPVVLPIAAAARHGFAAHDLDEAQAGDVRVGRKLDLDLGHPGPVALFAPDGTFLALYEQSGEQARAVAVFV